MVRTSPRTARSTALLLVLTLAACGAPGPQRTVTGVTIPEGDQFLVVGEGVQLSAVVATTGGDAGVAWSTSDVGVADVDEQGTVVATGPGAATVSATSRADPSQDDRITVDVDPQGKVHWTAQFGTAATDWVLAVAVDQAGAVIAAGSTQGSLQEDNAGGFDAFVRKYDAHGVEVWTRQFGTTAEELALDVAAGPGGLIAVVGYTDGALDGDSAGGSDAFVRLYDSAGDEVWTRQFGASDLEVASAVAFDASGAIVVAGDTLGDLDGPNAGSVDVFVRKYDPGGDLLWARQFGSSENDRMHGLAIDPSGNIVVAGETHGDIGDANAGPADVFVRKYDPTGGHAWTRQFGSQAHEFPLDVATDPNGNVYLVGSTLGDLEGGNLGDYDAFLRKYDPSGNFVWATQFGTSGFDDGRAVATDAAGAVIVTGTTHGDLDGDTAGEADVFVRKYDPDGQVRWATQFGTIAADHGIGVATDPDRRVVVVGITAGALGGDNAGGTDVFVRVFGR
jgi:hypothetical protein